MNLSDLWLLFSFIIFALSGYFSGKKNTTFVALKKSVVPSMILAIIFAVAGFFLSQLPFDYPQPKTEAIAHSVLVFIKVNLFILSATVVGAMIANYLVKRSLV